MQKLTLAIVFGVTILLVLYDIWAAFTPGATISEVMLLLAHKHPIVPFALGALMAHLFWSQAAEGQYQASVEARSRNLPTPRPSLWFAFRKRDA